MRMDEREFRRVGARIQEARARQAKLYVTVHERTPQSP
jgi:hypothetical protein